MGNVNARTRVSGLTYTVEEDRSEERDFNNLEVAEGVENGPSRPESAQSGHCARSGSSDSESGEPPPDTPRDPSADEAELNRLASLSTLQYERERGRQPYLRGHQ